MTDQFFCSAILFVGVVLQGLTLSSGQTCTDSTECDLEPACKLHWLDNDWVLLFRLSTKTQTSAYSRYIDSFGQNDLYENVQPVPSKDCLESSGDCKIHYRSGLLDIWEYAGIDKVNVSIYKDGVKKAFILFDGKDTNNTSWFSKKKVLESSWLDLKMGSHNNFSIAGHILKPRYKRVFFIFSEHSQDLGWLAVIDQADDDSAWGQAKSAEDFYPRIVYAPSRTSAAFEEEAEVDRADVLIISVKFAVVTRPTDCP